MQYRLCLELGDDVILFEEPGDVHPHRRSRTTPLFASEVASLRELMARMGHSSTQAALIYQHAQRDRERAIADAVSAKLTAELARRKQT